MSAFVLPPFLVDPATLPPAIRISESGSFARYTFTERIPSILKDTLALNSFPRGIRKALEELGAELAGGAIRGLREEAEDRAFWNAVSAPHIGRSWLDAPWYWAEAFFYRRLLEATGYFQPGPWNRVDPIRADEGDRIGAGRGAGRGQRCPAAVAR